jgi:hypothetical protein
MQLIMFFEARFHRMNRRVCAIPMKTETLKSCKIEIGIKFYEAVKGRKRELMMLMARER